MQANLNKKKELTTYPLDHKEKVLTVKDSQPEAKSFKKEKMHDKVNLEIEKDSPNSNAQVRSGPGLAEISNLQKAQREKQRQIEKVMEDNLEQVYLSLTPLEQTRFKVRGEKTAAQINDLLEKGKATVKNIIDLLKKWLSAIPGVNKYFLEQEAKIKADKIMEMKDS